MVHWVLKIIMTPVLRVMFRVRSEGTSNVPRKVVAAIALSGQGQVDQYASRDRARRSAPGSEAEPFPLEGGPARAATA